MEIDEFKTKIKYSNRCKMNIFFKTSFNVIHHIKNNGKRIKITKKKNSKTQRQKRTSNFVLTVLKI